MNRRTLMTTALLGLATAALPQVSFAQSSSLIGTWKLNLDKSKLVGPSPRSATLTYTQDGQNIRLTAQGIDAQGNSTTTVFMHIYDGMPHPTTGSPFYDASAYTRVDENTLIVARFKAGKLVLTGSLVVSQDGKTLTGPQTGIQADGQSGDTIQVYDKQ
jgi:hypothetical protein